ncbi:hypothetical protein, partial [Halomonas lysinitropha]|uniref:hypothetical protein n=1 Tax=Halomonas lysinitropha TaxID=2607506 RepID=UPI001788BC09
MSTMNEELLGIITDPIIIDETDGVQGESDGKDEIPIEEDWETLFPGYNFAEPENLAKKEGVINTSKEVTDIGWVVNLDEYNESKMKAKDPNSGEYKEVELSISDDGTVLTGTIQTDSGTVTAFIAVIVEGASSTSYDVYLLSYLPVEHSDTTSDDDAFTLAGLYVEVSAQEDIDFDFAGAPAGQNAFMAFTNPTNFPQTPEEEDEAVSIVVTGRTVDDTVNSSQANTTSLGTNNQNVDPGESLVVTYVKGMNSNYLVPDLTSTEAKDDGNIDFDSLQTATEASVTLVKFTPPKAESKVVITTYTTEQETGGAFIPGIEDNDDQKVEITEVKVNGESWVEGVSSWSWSLGNDGFTAVIEGIKNNDTITFQTEESHNRFIVENGEPEGSNVSWNIGGISIGDVNVETDVDPITLQFDDDGPTVTVTEDTTFDAPSLTTQDADTIGEDDPATTEVEG